jgi:hypothetical protein
MDGAGQLLSTVRVLTSTGRRLATLDLIKIVNRLSAPVRMVPRRVLLERLLEGFPSDRIRCNSRAVGVVTTHSGVRIEFEDGSSADGDLMSVRMACNRWFEMSSEPNARSRPAGAAGRGWSPFRTSTIRKSHTSLSASTETLACGPLEDAICSSGLTCRGPTTSLDRNVRST